MSVWAQGWTDGRLQPTEGHIERLAQEGFLVLVKKVGGDFALLTVEQPLGQVADGVSRSGWKMFMWPNTRKWYCARDTATLSILYFPPASIK